MKHGSQLPVWKVQDFIWKPFTLPDNLGQTMIPEVPQRELEIKSLNTCSLTLVLANCHLSVFVYSSVKELHSAPSGILKHIPQKTH